jgi:hypothetical protein
MMNVDDVLVIEEKGIYSVEKISNVQTINVLAGLHKTSLVAN